jgi:hypothetical protein
MTDKEWLEWADKDLASGGLACTREEAELLATERAMVDGQLPCEYPRAGGGCYVADLGVPGGVGIVIREVLP